MVDRLDPAFDAFLGKTLVMRLDQFAVYLRGHEHSSLSSYIVEVSDRIRMISVDYVVERLDLIICDGCEKRIDLFRIGRHCYESVLKVHKSGKPFENAVSKAEIHSLVLAVRSAYHLALHLVRSLPVEL